MARYEVIPAINMRHGTSPAKVRLDLEADEFKELLNIVHKTQMISINDVFVASRLIQTLFAAEKELNASST